MKINFGNYTYFDGDADGGVYNSTDIPQNHGWQNLAFDESKFNELINNRQYQDAADYAAQFHFNDPVVQKQHESDIINLRRSGRVLGSVYSRVKNPEDLEKITFADNVFVDGGLERINNNVFASELEKYKAQTGSELVKVNGEWVIGKEATSLAITFSPAKQTLFGIDFLASDNENTIENFYNNSGLSQEDLRNAGVNIINKDGKTTLRFNKSNPLANKIIYYTPVKRDRNTVGDIPTSDAGGNIAATIQGYDNEGNALNSWSRISEFQQLISDAIDTKQTYFEEIDRDYKDYSSTVGPLISDELASLRASLQNGDINETQYNQQAKILAPHVFSAINSLGSSRYEMYTNNFNDKDTDETLMPANIIQKAQLANLISNYAPKDIDVSAMVSNGKIGALITLEGTGNEDKAQENNGRRIQIFVPGLLQEEAQAKINRNTSTRAAQELNDMLDWGYDYKFRDGSTLEVNAQGQFVKDGVALDKASAIREIDKDMIMEDALYNLKYQYLNSDNKLYDAAGYEQMSRLLAMNAVQDLYGDIRINVNPQTKDVTLTDKFGKVYNPDDIFDRKIDRSNTQYEIYSRFEEIYSMYNELMNELNYYK